MTAPGRSTPAAAFPLPGMGRATVAVPAPGPGPGRWVGASSASGRPGTWDARGARVTTVLPDGRAAYDGRATKEENFSERTGLASPGGPDGRLVPEGDGPVADVRYLDVLPLPDGGHRLWYEAPLPDGSYELRTELVSWPTKRTRQEALVVPGSGR
jgi:hypothetical protein